MRFPLALLLLLCSMPTFASTPEPQVPERRFQEVWGYVIAGEEKALAAAFPITDLAYFGASLSARGDLVSVPDLRRVQTFSGRRHLVVALLDNQALAHMVLSPDFPVRARLIAAIAEAGSRYDGVQIDFETILTSDREHFWSFLKDLKRELGGRILSIALPARTKAVDDPFDYRKIEPLVDRIVVMAYDEHWSGSGPGPIASLAWGRKVAEYSMQVIPTAKLIMGAPLYGRAWIDKRLARAHVHSGVSQIQAEKGIAAAQRAEGIPTFSYQETVNVTVYYEDVESQKARLALYSGVGAKAVAFWRLGQEDPSLWPLVFGAEPQR